MEAMAALRLTINGWLRGTPSATACAKRSAAWVGVMISTDNGKSWKSGQDVHLSARRQADRVHAINGLDEPAEAALYRLLQERLPNATIVSIGHRSTLAAFHKRRLTLTREGERYVVKEAALNPVAS